MGRVLLISAVLFAVPTGLYIVWLVFLAPVERRKTTGDIEWEKFPWFWLIISGALCVAVGLAVLITFEQGTIGEVYEAPRLIDGGVAPGRFRPREGDVGQ